MKRKIEVPTYTKDIVGKIEQFDERDTIFAVHDLIRYFGEDSPASKEYFAVHPDEKKFYELQSQKLKLGSTGKEDIPFFSSQFWALHLISPNVFVDGESAPHPINLEPTRASEKIKDFAKFLGADLVGIAPLKQAWVYSHVGCSNGDHAGFYPRGTCIELTKHSNAIALGFHMDFNLMQAQPHFPELIATAKGYSSSAWVSIQLAATIRQWGFSARAHHFGNYQVLPVPIAVDCGLGELSRAGYLLTKEFGLGLRLAVVTTNMPLSHDKPVDLGVQTFCEQCQLCARSCPVGAIPCGPKQEHNGVLKWKIDEKKCYAYWAVNQTSCGMCMSTCPWTKPPTLFHKTMAEFASIKGPHQRWMAWADHFVYGKKGLKRSTTFLD
jgi:ferredoxin